MKQTTSLQCKGTKRGGPGTGVGVAKQKEICKETASVGLQKGADGLSFTMVCIPKGMHSCPRVRDKHMAALCSSWLEDAFAVLKTYYCE